MLMGIVTVLIKIEYDNLLGFSLCAVIFSPRINNHYLRLNV